MKPTFEISRPSRPSEPALRSAQISSRPITDWAFQSSVPDLRGGATSFHPGACRLQRPGFHTLSQAFFATEANREMRCEGALFGLMIALASWPIALAVQAAATLLK